MNLSLLTASLVLSMLAIPTARPPLEQEPGVDMAAMMEKAKRFTEPGENHKFLERFLGTWDMETRFFIGAKPTPPEKGKATFRWKMEGRWIENEWSGTMMGKKMTGGMWLGYDNFKMSYVATTISSMDTAMTRMEGDLTHDGKALLMYGTLDEYTTGEHDKMVKYVWRFLSADKMVLEVHDLPIGEENTKVVEFTYTRAK